MKTEAEIRERIEQLNETIAQGVFAGDAGYVWLANNVARALEWVLDIDTKEEA